eukprot:TRINITY_DN17793_c0_g1_i1.p1 TRINITY_DN17793_c0_g1~~TRINITY_DN17793_c0_g1_i1.p1  ORF type:complete len:975 (+),score=83.71 TRINITY_DN17793_c0_g1_i1:3-2927(+)
MLPYYKREMWGSLYPDINKEMSLLIGKGIPNSLRINLWLDLSKFLNIFYQTQFCLHPSSLSLNLSVTSCRQLLQLMDSGFLSHFEEQPQYQQDKEYFIYRSLYIISMELTTPQVEAALEDLNIFTEQETLDYIDITQLGNVLRVFCVWTMLFRGSAKIIYCKPQIKILRKVQNFVKSRQFSMGVQEEKIFWVFLCIVTQWLKNYYDISYIEKPEKLSKVNLLTSQLQSAAANVQQQGPFSSFQSQTTTSVKHNIATTRLSYSTQSYPFSIKEDILALRYYIREKLPEIDELFFKLGFPVEHYFMELMLSIFSGFFYEELLFRIWDHIAFEQISEQQQQQELQNQQSQENKLQQVVVCAILTFLKLNSALILKCKCLNELFFALDTASLIQTNCDEFITNMVSIMNQYYSQKQGNTLLNTLKNFSMKITSSDLSSYLGKYENLVKQAPYDNSVILQNLAVKLLLEEQLNQLQGAQPNYQFMKKFVGKFVRGFKTQTDLQHQIKATRSQLSSQYSPNTLQTSYLSQVKKIFFFIHDIQIRNFYSKIEIHLTYSNQKKIITFKDIANLQIFESFNYRADITALEITVYEILNEFVVPIYFAVINTQSYFPDILFKDIALLDNRIYQEQEVLTYVPEKSYMAFSIILSTLTDAQDSQQQGGTSAYFQNIIRSHAEFLDTLIKSSEIKCFTPSSIPLLQSDFEEWQTTQTHLHLPSIQNSLYLQQAFLWKLNFYATKQEFNDFLRANCQEWAHLNFTELFCAFKDQFNYVDFIILLILHSQATLKQKAKLLVQLLMISQDSSKLQEKKLVSKETLKILIYLIYQKYNMLIPLNQIHVDTFCKYTETRSSLQKSRLSIQSNDFVLEARDLFLKVLGQNAATYGLQQCPFHSSSFVNLSNQFFVVNDISLGGEIDLNYFYDNQKIAQHYFLHTTDRNDLQFYLGKNQAPPSMNSQYDQSIYKLMKTNDCLLYTSPSPRDQA